MSKVVFLFNVVVLFKVLSLSIVFVLRLSPSCVSVSANRGACLFSRICGNTCLGEFDLLEIHRSSLIAISLQTNFFVGILAVRHVAIARSPTLKKLDRC